jgi:arylsulfatase A-like enzyme
MTEDKVEVGRATGTKTAWIGRAQLARAWSSGGPGRRDRRWPRDRGDRGEAEFVDERSARSVPKKLEALGELDNAIVIFTADHGADPSVTAASPYYRPEREGVGRRLPPPMVMRWSVRST